MNEPGIYPARRALMAANQTFTRTRGKRVAGFIGLLFLVPGIAAASLTAGYSTASAAPVAINPTLASLAAPRPREEPVPVEHGARRHELRRQVRSVARRDARRRQRGASAPTRRRTVTTSARCRAAASSRRRTSRWSRRSARARRRASASARPHEWKTACKGPECDALPVRQQARRRRVRRHEPHARR